VLAIRVGDSGAAGIQRTGVMKQAANRNRPKHSHTINTFIGVRSKALKQILQKYILRGTTICNSVRFYSGCEEVEPSGN